MLIPLAFLLIIQIFLLPFYQLLFSLPLLLLELSTQSFFSILIIQSLLSEAKPMALQLASVLLQLLP